MRTCALLALLLPLAGCIASSASPRGVPSLVDGQPRIAVTVAKVSSPDGKLLGRLAEGLETADEKGEEVEVMADLRLQADLGALAARMDREGLEKQERRDRVAAAVRAVAARSASRLEPFLEDLVQEGFVREYQQFVCANRYWVAATPDGVRRLAEHKAIARLRWANEHLRIERPRLRPSPLSGDEAPPSGRETARHQFLNWGLDAMGAPGLWKQGITGAGVVVGAIDTGASVEHEQLRDGFRGGEHSWFDASGAQGTEPRDPAGHGTGVLSLAVGRPAGERPGGVAPGAMWIVASTFRGPVVDHRELHAATDWMLLEGRPDVLIHAWWFTGKTDCDPYFDRVIAVLRLAEIFQVFAGGNADIGSSGGVDPGNTKGLSPDGGAAFSVGAVTRFGKRWFESSRGPSACGGIHPQVCAPGSTLSMAGVPGPDTYTVGSGTSFAAGYAGGAVALLMEAFPEARVIEIEAAMRESARDFPPPGPDNECGHGVIHLPGALRWLEERSAPPAGGEERP